MAFLTIIAPLVAMTYPLDKITDGKAQAFDAWLKEYIFNLMIQPLHLLLYTILVSSAFALASESPIYALVAIGFMMPAEKLMRRFFGFEKAKTPGLLGGAAGAAIAMTGLQSILKPKRHGGKSSGAGEGSKDSNNVKFVNKNNVNAMDAIAGEGMPLTENPVEKAARAAALENKAKKVEVQAANEATRLKIRENAKEASRLKQEQEAKIREAVEQTKRDKAKRIKGVAKVLAVGAGKQVLAGTLRGIRPDRLAGKLVGGTAAATSGLLLGVASGDPTKAFQYTTGGAVAGSALAESFADNKLLDGKELLDEAEMAYWGDDYKEHIIEKQKEEFQNNSANIAYIRKTTGASEKEAEDILETTGGYCFDHGITNVEDITAIHQHITGDNHISLEKALAAREYAHKRLPSDTDKMTAKAIKEHKDRWAQEYKERFTHLSDAQAHALADESFNLAIRFNKTKSGLTKL